LENLIKDSYAFTIIYQILPEKYQNQLIESFQEHLENLIKDGYDFKIIYQILPKEHQNQLFESFKGRWQDLIKNGSDFLSIYRTLPREHQNQLFESFQEHLENLIKDSYAFTIIYQILPEKYQNQLFESFKGRWQDLIKNGPEFLGIYRKLPREHQNQLFESFQGHWQDVIKDVLYFRNIYQTISIEHKNQLIIFLLSEALTKSHSIQESLIDLLKTPSSDVWSVPVFQQVLITLNNGVQKLQHDYKPTSIETFLKALFSQDPEQIKKAPRALLRKSKSQILSCSLFSQNKPENINEILQTYFSEFLPQKGPDEPRPNKLTNSL
jgi:hypothetical protein